MVEIKGSAVLDSITGIKKRDGERATKRSWRCWTTKTGRCSWARVSLPAGIHWICSCGFGGRAEVVGTWQRRVLVTRCESVVERQLRSVYKIFVRVGSPEFLMKRIAAVHATYFNGVGIDFKLISIRNAVIRYTGFEPQHRLIGLTLIGFFRKVLELSAAKDRTVRFTTPIDAGKGYADLAVNSK